MIRKTLSRALLFFTLFGSITAQADEFVIGVEDIEYYPIYAKIEGVYSGYSRELLDTFAKAEGHTFTYKELPIKRLFKEFIDKELDFKFPDSPYWKKDLKVGAGVLYSDSVLEYIDGVLVNPENLSKGKDNLKKLGVLRGFTAWDYLADKKVIIKENNSLDSLVKMAQGGRIDGIYFNIVVANYFLEKNLFQKDALAFDPNLPHTRSHYYLSTIKHPKIIDSFNKFLSNNKALVESLKQKYNVNI